ncbi:MAG: hypothetical protein JWR30_2779, partial [Conexibacter sp.]|nr:hypothetical protein [Conexibacter sp.]
MGMDFDGLIAWMDGHVGRRVFVATQSALEEAGNTRLTLIGPLARVEDGEITLIDPRPGRIEVFQVGDGGTLVLLEGDFVTARPIDFGQGFPQIIEAEFLGAVGVTLGEAPADAPAGAPAGG